MKYNNFIGVDISKNTLDFAFISAKDRGVVLQLQCPNTAKDLNILLREIKRHHCSINKSSMVCCEHTGVYSRHLINFLAKRKCAICVETGLRIKKSFGIQRGKSDLIDSKRIAEYALRNSDKLRLWKNPRDAIFQLHDLLNLRKKLIAIQNAINVPLRELTPFYKKQKSRYIYRLCEEALKGAGKSLLEVEGEITNLVKSDALINKTFHLLTSIPGVGKYTALYLIYFTHEFSKTTSAKQLASYAGVAPFEYSSGTSVKGKPHVHPLANKLLKSLLHLGAVATATIKGREHYAYYQKKLKEGKHKMSVLNAVRNKIVNASLL